jgi:hypothetical protein
MQNEAGQHEAWSEFELQADGARPPEPVVLEKVQALRCALHSGVLEFSGFLGKG